MYSRVADRWSSLTVIFVQADAIYAKPLKAWLACWAEVDLDNQVEGGQDIGNVIETPDFGF